MITASLTFSLVVNTTDRAGPLETLLHSLEHQSYPHFEVVVVVGPTKDNTLDILSDYEGRLQVLRCPVANLCRSRNIGLQAARGDIVAFIDDDAVPSRRWIEQLARLFEDPNLDATGGVVYLAHPNRAQIQHRIGITSSLAEQVNVRTSWLEYIVPPGEGCQWISRMMGTNMAFRRRALLEVGGFDEFFEWVYDESDLSFRLSRAGKNVHPVKEAAVYHIPASSRNRVAFTSLGRWWIQTKASVYFTIKNGRAAGDSWSSISMRCLHLLHGHWLSYGKHMRDKQITFGQCWIARLKEIFSAFNGMFAGLFRSRHLIDSSSKDSPVESDNSIMRFQDKDSGKQPVVDPVSGRQALAALPKTPLRICLLSSAYPPARFGGVGRHTHLMAQGLFECGHSVHVITRGERERVSFYDGAFVHEISCRRNRYRRYRRLPALYDSLNYSHAIHEKVKRLILNEGIQIVDSPMWQIEGLVTAVSGAIPVAVRLQTAHRQIAALERNRDEALRLMGEMEQALLEQASYLIPNSRATLKNARKIYGISPSENHYTVIPHGIIPVLDEKIRPFDLGRTDDTLTVLYVGRLEKRKGILDLFGAIPRVLDRIPNAAFIIVGRDNSQNDGFKRRTGMNYPSYFADRYSHLEAKVSFTGRVSDQELEAYYQSCDLFVAPSLYESFGLVYLEAMNYAKPVIGGRAGGVPEVIEEGVTGLLSEPEDSGSLADAMIRLLGSPTKLYEMGIAGRDRLLSRFTYLQMAEKFAQAYRTVIEQSE
jgi:hypothetical protein